MKREDRAMYGRPQHYDRGYLIVIFPIRELLRADV